MIHVLQVPSSWYQVETNGSTMVRKDIVVLELKSVSKWVSVHPPGVEHNVEGMCM